MPCHEHVGGSRQHLHLAGVLKYAAQPGLLKAKLSFDRAKRMLHFGAEVCFGRLDQIIHSSLGCIGQGPALAGPHGNSEADTSALHLGSLINSLVSGIAINHGLLTMQ